LVIKHPLRYALTLCRRVLFMLAALFLLLAGLLWTTAPDINQLRPDIESYLKQEMQLRDVELGRLSWYWAWNVGIKSDRCSFRNQDDSLMVSNAQLSVQLSTWRLLFGTVSPYKIHLAHGHLGLNLGGQGGDGHGQMPGRLLMDDMTVAWRFHQYQGEVQRFGMDFDGSGRRLVARLPGASLQATWNETLLPERVKLEFSDMAWLPQPWRAYVEGEPSGRLVATRLGGKRWLLQGDAQGAAVAWVIAQGPFRLPFDEVHAEATLHLGSTGEVSRLELMSLQWRNGGDMAEAAGQWHLGLLEIDATAPHLQMPMLWSWLQGMGDAEWLQWLGRMHEGEASAIKAKLQLPWMQPGRAWPTEQELASMRYHVSGRVKDVDIALGLKEPSIRHLQGAVDLDEKMLRAEFVNAELPYGIGAGRMTLAMPWESTVLDLTGEGQADVGKLHAWLDPEGAEKVQWKSAPAHAAFTLKWQPKEQQPRMVEVRLKPTGGWQVAPNQLPLAINGGTLLWSLEQGLHAEGLHVRGELMEGELSFQAQHDPDQGWRVSDLQAKLGGDFARIVRHFQLPVSKPSGSYGLQFTYKGEWQSRLDLSAAAWQNLLGQAKSAGVAMEVHSQGRLDMENRHLDISRVECLGEGFQLEGSGELSAAGLKVVLSRLQTPAFDGAISVQAPFGEDPWEMDVEAVRVERKALPQQLPETKALAAKPWSLRAKVGKFIWDDAQMQDVQINLASKEGSVGVFKAAGANIGAIKVKDVSAVFTLPGRGEVDLRHFAAAMGSQRVMLSAWLAPNPEGGMHWRGFAEMEGDFGLTMHRTGMTDLFSGGRMRALFSGEGELLREQPWWQGLDGRLRLRVDDGQVLAGGTLTKFLSAISLADLPKLLLGQRKDLQQEGLFFKRMQVEATLHGQTFNIKKLAIRSPAMDMAGHGVMNLENSEIDLLMVVRPFQNLDAMLAKVPLARDLFGGAAHSFLRKAYHLFGTVADAKVEEISPQAAGLASPGLIESLLSLPEQWFDKGKAASQ